MIRICASLRKDLSWTLSAELCLLVLCIRSMLYQQLDLFCYFWNVRTFKVVQISVCEQIKQLFPGISFYFIHFIFVIFLASEIQTGPRPINTIHIDYTVLPYSKEQIHFENSISPAMLTRLVIQRSDHYVLQRNRTIFWTSLWSFTQFFFVFTAVCFYIQYLNEILRCDLISHSNWTQEWK